MPNPRPSRRDHFVEDLLAACRADEMVRAGGTLVVAFSGGPDSTALLHGLWKGSSALHLDLRPVHVDHGLRAGSGGDAVKAQRFAAELGVGVEVVKLGAVGAGEDAARRGRHRALETAARQVGAHSVALGHTRDDQAETVLLHLLRGSGLGGLGGMRPREGARFRPMLEISRAEVLGYCRRHHLQPLVDPSNADPAFTRNRVRHELLPLLEERFNPQVKLALARLADAARDQHGAVRQLAQAWLASQRGLVSRRQLAAQATAIQVEVLRAMWGSAAGLGQLPGGARKLQQALRLVRGTGDGMIQLGAGYELLADEQSVAIRHRTPGRGPLHDRDEALTGP